MTEQTPVYGQGDASYRAAGQEEGIRQLVDAGTLSNLPGGQIGFLFVVNIFIFFLAFFIEKWM